MDKTFVKCDSPGQHGVVGGGGQVRGDVERGCGGCGRGGRGRRHGGTRVLVQFAGTAAARLVFAEYARNGKRRVRRCGRLDGRRFAATAAAAGRHRGGRGRPGARGTAVAATFVIVVVAGYVDPRRLGHSGILFCQCLLLIGTRGTTAGFSPTTIIIIRLRRFRTRFIEKIIFFFF